MGNKLNHILILPDGHRRWARKNGISYRQSYEFSSNRLPRLFEHIFFVHNIPEISFMWSYDYNFQRKGPDLNDLLEVSSKGIINLANEKNLKKGGVEINLVGETNLLEKHLPDYPKIFNLLEERNEHILKPEKKLHLLFAYSPEIEFQRALSSLVQVMSPKDITFDLIRQKLYSPNTYNLMIFTGQFEYEEQKNPFNYFATDSLHLKRGRMYTSKKLFPELDLGDVDEAVNGWQRLDWISKNVSGRKKFE